MLPSGDDARLEYTGQGGSLTAFGEFGIDPLKDRPDLISRRNTLLAAQARPYDSVFSNTASGDGQLLKQCILTFVDLTQRLQHLL